jgi:hypothetical protein
MKPSKILALVGAAALAAALQASPASAGHGCPFDGGGRDGALVPTPVKPSSPTPPPPVPGPLPKPESDPIPAPPPPEPSPIP